ncbi:MAG TPA: hypothetical protein VES65_01835, partial [Solirubrobacteraceae bacterium]|nr:hypothetical protein [Solirubrobacteraceae bacterium]
MAAAVVVLALALVLAAPASASFEKVGVFGAPGEEGQLSEFASGVAVNDTTHDVYVADGYGNRVYRFSSKGELLEGWGWGVADNKGEFERCGKDGEAAHPKCNQEVFGVSGEGVGEFKQAQGIAVDQTTGYVYVLNTGRQNGVVQVFKA